MRTVTKIIYGIVGLYVAYVLVVVITNIMPEPKMPTSATIVVQADIKPSYDYLKSVTVVVYGKGIETAESAKEEIETEKEDGDVVKWMGTGVIVKITPRCTYILTNAHVTGSKMNDVSLYIKDEIAKVEAQIVKVHKNADLAIIRVRGHLIGKQAIKGITAGHPQDKVYLVGNYLGHIYTYAEGVFAGYDEEDDIIQLPCLFGDSGSGVFNQEGKLVALVEGVEGRIIRGIFPLVDVAHALAVDSATIELFLITIHYK